MRRRWAYMVPLGILGMAVFIALGGEIVHLLWNWLLPSVFGWRAITFWQAIGIVVLCRILFGGFGGHRSVGPRIRGRMAERMADRVGDRWERMTPDEREKFRQRVRERCGFDPAVNEGK